LSGVKTRPLGATGIDVSEIGFGAWGIGGATAGATSYGATDDARSLSALARAFELGITLYDTSNAYGDGHSEYLIGRAFSGRRERVVIATKAGFPRFDQAQDFTPAHLRRSLEASLRRLGTDHVDLFQLHSPPITLVRDERGILETLKALQREGKTRSFGISVKAPDDARIAIEELGFPVVQLNLNLVDQRAWDTGLLDLAAARGVGIITRTPLCFGLLAGKVAPDTVFDPADHRSAWPKAQIARWIDGSRLFVSAVADRARQTPAQVALRFCLSHPAVSSTIPGILAPAEAEENAGVSALGPLSSDEIAEIRRIYAGESFFVGRG
jgi:aryl-alcohol dehydrogenase-like predicted oxidoreductase